MMVGGGVTGEYWHLHYLTSTACTCSTAGGMPLAFTQEDFLVELIYLPVCVPVKV